MIRRLVVVIAVVLGFMFISELARADLERLSFEHRDARELDNQVERGSASVTTSPIFTEGIRLACWACEKDQAALASAIYYFDIPDSARSVKIRIPYIGEKQRNGTAGGVWVRRTGSGAEYYPDKEKYEATEALYGDTFILKDNRFLESIEVSASEHRLDDGRMELHLVAEGSQQIDVRYIEVETYAYPRGERVIEREYYSPPSVRVVERYYPSTTTVYVERPWWDPYWPYWYWYTGPVYCWEWADGVWIRVYYRYPYPRYYYHYAVVWDYWDTYYARYPYYGVHWVDVYRVRHRPTVGLWNRDCEVVRRDYVAARDCGDPQRVPKERIRSVLTNHKQRREATIATVSARDRTEMSELVSRRETGPQKTRREERRTSGLFTEKAAPGRVIRSAESSDQTRSEVRGESPSSGLFEKRKADIETRRSKDDLTRSSMFSHESVVETRRGMSSEPQKVRREGVRQVEQRAQTAPGREVIQRSVREEMKQRPEVVRTSPQQRIEVQRQVRSEPRPTPQVKQRPAVERSASSASARSTQDDEEKKRQSASSSGSSAGKRRGR